MRRLGAWLAGLAVVGAIAAIVFAWWNFDLRWRPKTLGKHQAEIARILEQSGWVSPGTQGPKLYMVSFRTCPECIRFRKEQFPALTDAGVDIRLILFARRDRNGQSFSTAVERSTVAELWINRSWALAQRWDQVPADAWTARYESKELGIPPADGDIARTAVVEASRKTVDDLEPLLRANGVNLSFPVLIWWTKDGTMRACSCGSGRGVRHVREELGVK